MRWRIHELVVTAIFMPALAHAAIVSDGWFRALPAGLPSAGYFTLANPGTAALSLIGAQSPACGMLMLHKSSDSSGMSMMSDVASVDIPPGGQVKFAPGSYHLMCMNPTQAMKPDANVPVTLMFADKSVLLVFFAVKNAKGR